MLLWLDPHPCEGLVSKSAGHYRIPPMLHGPVSKGQLQLFAPPKREALSFVAKGS